MQPATARFDRLDRVVLICAAVLAVAVLAIGVRGDQVGASVLRSLPADSAQNVSVRTPLTFTFTEPLDAASFSGKVRVEPPLSGTVRVNGSTLIFSPVQPLRPNTAYRIVIDPGGRSTRGRAMVSQYALSFTTRQTRLAYMAPSGEIRDVYLTDPESGATQRVTSEPYGVFDFAISPDGSRAAVSITRDKTGSRDLWLVNLDGSGRERLVECTEEVCQTPAWSADGQRIAFERRKLIQRTIGKLPGPSRIWLYDIPSQSSAPLFEDAQRIGALPRWSPVDDRLLFVDSSDSMLSVIDTVSQQSTQIPSRLGDPGAWSPDGSQVIYSDILEFEDFGFSQMFRANLVSGVITTVLPVSTTNDAAVSWSPDGAQLAFSRQIAGTRGAIGAQIWLTPPDGAAPGAGLRQLTNNNAFTHAEINWSPDRRWLSARRFELREQYAKPQIILVRLDSGETRLLLEDAMSAEWVP
jgi:Tol biopolymer transport system component